MTDFTNFVEWADREISISQASDLRDLQNKLTQLDMIIEPKAFGAFNRVFGDISDKDELFNKFGSSPYPDMQRAFRNVRDAETSASREIQTTLGGAQSSREAESIRKEISGRPELRTDTIEELTGEAREKRIELTDRENVQERMEDLESKMPDLRVPEGELPEVEREREKINKELQKLEDLI